MSLFPKGPLFEIVRCELAPDSEKDLFTDCPPGPHVYEVTLTGKKGSIAQLVTLAGALSDVRMSLHRTFNCSNSLNLKDLRTDLGRLTHAIEHLVVIDLAERGCIAFSKLKEPLVGTRVTLGRTVMCNDGRCFFWIRGDLVSSDEEIISIRRIAIELHGIA